MSRKFLKARCPAISHIQQISLFSQGPVQNLSQANRVFSIEEHEPFTERAMYTPFRHKCETACVESA